MSKHGENPWRSEKERLRNDMRARLAGISEAEARQAAERMAGHLLSLPEMQQARNIFSCLSFGTEIDTRRLIRRWIEDGGEGDGEPSSRESARVGTVFVPRNLPRRRLALHPYPCETRLTSYGLEQPVRQAPRLPDEAIDNLRKAFKLG